MSRARRGAVAHRGERNLSVAFLCCEMNSMDGSDFMVGL